MSDESAVDRLADQIRCSKERATGMVVQHGGKAWKRCVRVRDHDGDCVLALCKLEEEVLAGERRPDLVIYGSEFEIRERRWLAEHWWLR